jgi:hypothetical protein
MARSARQVKRSAHPDLSLSGGVAALGAMVSRNPVLVGGSTAFLVALFYVSANALWYQPHAHTGAFFATRGFSMPIGIDDLRDDEPETTIRIERPEQPEQAPARPGDPVIEQVQRILKGLDFYAGAVDGLAGPNTTKAITDYQRKVGLTPNGKIDDQLLSQLGATASIEPVPAPPARHTEDAAVQTAATSNSRISSIQAGLRAFGNEGMEIDGVVGARTKAALLEFQSLFGLPETGEPDEATYVKMKEIGLTN